jgi:Xaa-Pro aminopeptidase
MASDWNDVRFELDRAENYSDIYNSPWYSDAEYDSFSDAEFGRRHRAARELMARDGIDALILTGGQNIYSLGAGVTWGCGLIDFRGMCQYLVLPRAGDPTLVYPHPGCHLEAVRRMVSIPDVRGGDHGHFGRVIGNRLTELGLERGRVGVTAADSNGPEYMGIAVHRELEACLPDLELVLCPTLFHELTYRKGAEEIRAMRRAGDLAIASLEAVARAAQPGVPEYALAAAGTEAIMAGGGHVHLMMIGATAMADPRLMYPNPNPSRRALRSGDIVLTEIAAAHLGYSAKIGHPITLGPPTEDMKRMYDVSLDVLREIESALGPGVDLASITAASGGYRRAGMQSRPMTLHGIDLITSGPKVSVEGVAGAGFDGELAPGMVVNIESTPLSADGVFGQFLSRTYAIEEKGVQCLTPYPVEELMTVG